MGTEVASDNSSAASRDSRLPPPAARLTNESDVRARMKEIRKYYEPFAENRSVAAPARFAGEPINPWQFRYTEGESVSESWHEITLPEYKGRSWWAGEYKTAFAVPQELRGFPRILLHFDGVETTVEAWVNRTSVGSHSGGSDPFDFDITGAIDPTGNNELRLTVTNGLCVNGTGYQRVFSGEPYRGEGVPYKLVGEWGNMNGRAGYAGGIWRDVKLVGTASAWISDALIEPDPEHAIVRLRIDCQTNHDFAGSVKVEVVPRNFPGTSVDATVEIEIPAGGERRSELSIEIPDQRWWSPDEPYLYTARVSLVSGSAGHGGPIDLQEYAFGQRRFRWDDSIKRYRLNGVPYRFRGTTTINSLNMAYLRGDIDFLVDQILLAKAAGFTMFRHHIMSPIREINDYLDAYGMLSQPEMPIWGRFHEELIGPALEQLPRIVRQHYNHPSTVLFAISSESAWEHEAYAEYQPQAISLMESMFPNLEWKIEGVRGNLSGIPGPRAEWGNLLEYKPGLYDAHEYPGWYVNLGSLEPVRDGETLMTIGEFGPESLSNLSTMKSCWPDGTYPADPTEPISRDELPFGPQYGFAESRWFLPTPASLDEWIAATQRNSAQAHRYMTSIYRRSPSVIGYHQYFLNEPVWNTWRKTLCGVDLSPKLPYYTMARANAPVLINLFLAQEHFLAGDDVAVRLFVANDSMNEISGARMELFLVGEDDAVIWNHSVSLAAPVAVPVEIDIPVFTLPAAVSSGEYSLRAFLTLDGQTLSDDDARVHVIDSDTWPTVAPRYSNGSMPIVHYSGSEASAAVAAHLQEQLGENYRALPADAIRGQSADWSGCLVVVDQVGEWDGMVTDQLVHHLRGGGRLLLRELEPGDLGWLVDGLSIVADPGRALFRPDEGHPLFGSGSDRGALTAADFQLWNFVPVEREIFRHPVMEYAAKRTRDIVDCPIRFRGKEFNRMAHISKDNSIRMFSVADADKDGAALLEIEYGTGRALICQAGVYRRYNQHPIARILMHREIEFLLSPLEPFRREKFRTISRF